MLNKSIIFFVFLERNDTCIQAINNVFYLIQTIVQNLYRTTYGFIIISHMTASSHIERTHTLKQDLRDEGRIGAEGTGHEGSGDNH